MKNALHSDSISPELRDVDRLYDWLIGCWEVRVVDYLEDGSKKVAKGEWHFGLVLEGRAIQDVWISPPRDQRDVNTPRLGNRYGTTIRFFHPDEKKWHIIWMNPVSGTVNRLSATREGEDIVQVGLDPFGNPMRWVFTDIKPRSARWYGERSFDGGATWKLEAEFFLKRTK